MRRYVSCISHRYHVGYVAKYLLAYTDFGQDHATVFNAVNFTRCSLFHFYRSEEHSRSLTVINSGDN